MSDRPICCLLSGGLDSSLIVSILCKLLGPENVRTFSIGMEGGIDLKYADKVAKYLGTQHTAVTFTETEAMAVIPEVIETIESHCITTIRASIANYLISKHISRETNNIVVFTGEGSDELFQGYLYFHNQPTPEEGSEESLRLMKELYIYDVLRCDRCVSENGLEPRVPFLDRHLVDYVLSLPPGLRCPRGGMEKYLLRKAFEHGYLPDEVLWRRKDGFSDACSSLTRPLRVCIAEYVETRVPDIEFDRIKSEYLSKEEYWYRKIFNILFPKYRPGMKSWMPKWSPGLTDPSGRLISAFDETEDDEDDEVEEVKSS
jgi:asparagine synthase (glutamine-hydrolysing)